MILASHAGGSSCFLSPYAIYIQKSYLITLSVDQRWRMFNFVYLFILLTFFVGTCLTFRETPIYVVRLTSVLPRKMAKFRPAPEVDVPASANTTKIPKKKKTFIACRKQYTSAPWGQRYYVPVPLQNVFQVPLIKRLKNRTLVRIRLLQKLELIIICIVVKVFSFTGGLCPLSQRVIVTLFKLPVYSSRSY